MLKQSLPCSGPTHFVPSTIFPRILFRCFPIGVFPRGIKAIAPGLRCGIGCGITASAAASAGIIRMPRAVPGIISAAPGRKPGRTTAGSWSIPPKIGFRMDLERTGRSLSRRERCLNRRNGSGPDPEETVQPEPDGRGCLLPAKELS